MDFVHDQLFDGRKTRTLTIVDAFTRYAPAIEPRFSWCGTGVVDVLEVVCQAIGYPRTIPVDQGPSSSRKILISGPIVGASSSTSAGRANRRTTPSLNR